MSGTAPSLTEMNTLVELNDLPHDVLASMVNAQSEARARSFVIDMQASVREMNALSIVIEGARQLIELGRLAHPHLTDASLALGKARDELLAYITLYSDAPSAGITAPSEVEG